MNVSTIVETVTVTVTIEDLHTDSVTSTQEVPSHLVAEGNWTTRQYAEWAVGNDDATVGRPVVDDWATDVLHFGAYDMSFVESFRAGARYIVSVSVATEDGHGRIL
jgi:hypothetical protein